MFQKLNGNKGTEKFSDYKKIDYFFNFWVILFTNNFTFISPY